MGQNLYPIPRLNARTEIATIKNAPIFETFNVGVVSLGSCFAHAMASRLQDSGFKSVWQELGAIYNPITLLQWLTESIPLIEEKVCTRDEVFLHHDAPSSIWGKDKDELLEKVLACQASLHKALSNAKVLLLTLGSAHVHELVSNGMIVGNNHKMPQQHFNSRMLSLAEIQANMNNIANSLAEKYPHLHIVLSVSPVRHTRIGLVENSLSKSLLQVAAHEICASNHLWHLFPAYEIMMDDLRDYRYYASDLLHPSKEAEVYIFAHFVRTYFTESTTKAMQEQEAIKRFNNHRPLIPYGKAYETWKLKTGKAVND